MQQFLQVMQEERQSALASSVDEHHAGDDGGPTKKARVDKDALRQAALSARLEYRKGARLSKSVEEDKTIYASLSKKDKTLLYQFENGDLLERRKEADNSYGHGRDVECLSFSEK